MKVFKHLSGFSSRTIVKDESGLIMPFVVGFLVILTTIGATLSQTSTQSFNNALNFGYDQVAHVASKAAIDFAEEAYEADSSYAGTPEQDLHVTSRYRSTIEIVILYNQGSNAKRISATGRVYVVNAGAGTADFTREIQASIIRNGAVSGNPADYEPVLWLDAGEPNSLFSSSSSSPQSFSTTSLYGSSNGDVAEERGSDAGRNPGQLLFGNDDLDMAWGGTNAGTQTMGIRFRDVQVPQGTSIDSAYIQFTTDQTALAGDVELQVSAVDSDNPGVWSGYYGITGQPDTGVYTNWNPPDWNTVGQAGTDERVEITNIVQDLLNRPGWNSGNAMAFMIDYVSGAGRRTAEKGRNGDDPILQINWTDAGGGSGPATNDGDDVGQWLDKSTYNNDANLAYGVDAKLRTNQINSLPAIEFTSNSILESALTSNITGDNLVAFAVMLPNSSTASSGRFVSAMNSSQTLDYNTQDSAIPFLRYSTGSTLTQYYDTNYGASRTGAVDNTYGVYTSMLSGTNVEGIHENVSYSEGNYISTINYDLDQIYVGGTRAGSTGSNYSTMNLAELIVYDQYLSCDETVAVEEFLGNKYNISLSSRSC